MTNLKTKETEVRNANATEHGEAEQTTLTEQKLMKKMKNKETVMNDVTNNDVYKRWKATFGCCGNDSGQAKNNFLPPEYFESEYKEYEFILADDYDDIDYEAVEARVESSFLAYGIEEGLCENCMAAYEIGAGIEYNAALENAMEEIEKAVNAINLTDERENAMIKKYLNGLVTSLRTRFKEMKRSLIDEY